MCSIGTFEISSKLQAIKYVDNVLGNFNCVAEPLWFCHFHIDCARVLSNPHYHVISYFHPLSRVCLSFINAQRTLAYWICLIVRSLRIPSFHAAQEYVSLEQPIILTLAFFYSCPENNCILDLSHCEIFKDSIISCCTGACEP